MTLDEFKAGQRTYNKVLLKIVAYFFLGMVLSVPVISFGDQLEERQRMTASHCLMVALLITWIVGFIALHRYDRREKLRLGLLCPHCQKPLLQFSSQIVVATGRCGHCGTQVLDG
jgi:hypothetical protein